MGVFRGVGQSLGRDEERRRCRVPDDGRRVDRQGHPERTLGRQRTECVRQAVDRHVGRADAGGEVLESCSMIPATSSWRRPLASSGVVRISRATPRGSGRSDPRRRSGGACAEPRPPRRAGHGTRRDLPAAPRPPPGVERCRPPVLRRPRRRRRAPRPISVPCSGRGRRSARLRRSEASSTDRSLALAHRSPRHARR